MTPETLIQKFCLTVSLGIPGKNLYCMFKFWLQDPHHLTSQSLGHDCPSTVDESLKNGKDLMYQPPVIF